MAKTPVWDREFLPLRAKIIEIAAMLDRIERTDPQAADDQRMQRLRTGIETVLNTQDDRAEQVQLLFSRPYDDAWTKEYGLDG